MTRIHNDKLENTYKKGFDITNENTETKSNNAEINEHIKSNVENDALMENISDLGKDDELINIKDINIDKHKIYVDKLYNNKTINDSKTLDDDFNNLLIEKKYPEDKDVTFNIINKSNINNYSSSGDILSKNENITNSIISDKLFISDTQSSIDSLKKNIDASLKIKHNNINPSDNYQMMNTTNGIKFATIETQSLNDSSENNTDERLTRNNIGNNSNKLTNPNLPFHVQQTVSLYNSAANGDIEITDGNNYPAMSETENRPTNKQAEESNANNTYELKNKIIKSKYISDCREQINITANSTKILKEKSNMINPFKRIIFSNKIQNKISNNGKI